MENKIFQGSAIEVLKTLPEKLGPYELNKIYCEDCLEALKKIPDKSVDLVLTDPPYGTTVIDWDKKINLKNIWIELKRIGKENCAFIFTSSQPFTTDLINSNRDWFRYCLVWEKSMCGNCLLANKMPLKKHEDIVIFYKQLPTYNVIKEGTKTYKDSHKKVKGFSAIGLKKGFDKTNFSYIGNFPTSIIKINNPNNYNEHPTQKPVNLMKWLIKRYSNINDIILDPYMGSGTTAVACKQLGRKFIGFEISSEYCKIANNRLKQEVLF